MLLAALIIIPALGALGSIFSRRAQGILGLVTTSLTLLLGGIVGQRVYSTGPLNLEFSWGIFTPSLRADTLSIVFTLFTLFIWWAVAWYIPGYMKMEKRASVFYASFLLTLSAVLGVFLAGNWFTLLFFFELMTLTSLLWVVFYQSKEAIGASLYYLFFSVLAGLFLAAGLVLLSDGGSGLTFNCVDATNPKTFSWGLASLLVAFGIKAGMVPLHLWLPKAHPVAPSPASALLSGILIKTGAYGLIRTGQLAGWGRAASWFGPALVTLGVITMLLGVGLALLQSNAKRLLAYHSVSQMGYIILGVGIGFLMGSDGGFGLGGALYHSLNHALFKSALFLGIGMIVLRTGQSDLYRMGGLWRQYPVTALCTLVAALGITGTPGLNGYASKTLLHHGLSQAASVKIPLVWVERCFLLVGIGTAASFCKLFFLTFLGKPRSNISKLPKESRLESLSLLFLAIAMVAIGSRPNWFVESALVPILTSFGMDTTSLTSLSFWNAQDLGGMVLTLGLGGALCWFGLRSGLFHWQPPTWLSLEQLGGIVLTGMRRTIWGLEEACERIWAALVFCRNGARLRMRKLVVQFEEREGSFAHIRLSNLGLQTMALVATFAILLIYFFWQAGIPA
ncbi:MAG: complex I subunit 5 family protein [Limnochordia bacterium]|nr:complex I subunit 5 family protein [Limnochordia bacterium]